MSHSPSTSIQPPEDNKRIAAFLYELGTMRKLPRMHKQALLTDDASDNIATHTYRVTMIGWFLAKLEGVDPYKVVMMCLCHDTGEIRTGDHNWIHKRYVKIFEEEVKKDQLGTLPFPDLFDIVNEYDKRENKEALVAKDADLLDQVLLLKEYALQGNKEAQVWLDRKPSSDQEEFGNRQVRELKTESGKKLARAILAEPASDWWNHIWTNKNR